MVLACDGKAELQKRLPPGVGDDRMPPAILEYHPMPTINDLSPDDLRQLARLAGQEWDDATVERLLPQVKGVLNAGKRIYDLDLGPTELAVTFELRDPGS